MPKTRRETKDLGMETSSGEGVVKEEKFPHNRNPSHRWICGEFWNLRGQHNWEGEKKKIPQNMSLTATASRQVAQVSATGEQRLDREAWTAYSVLRARTGRA